MLAQAGGHEAVTLGDQCLVQGRGEALQVLLLLLLYLGTIVLTVTSGRVRLALVPLLCPFAGYLVAATLRAWRAGPRWRPLVALVLAALVVHLPVLDRSTRRDDLAERDYNLAVQQLQTGELAPGEVEDLIATFLLTVGCDPRATPPILFEIVDRFARRAGVEPGEPRTVSEKKIRRHLELKPLNSELRIGFEQGVRESIAAEDTGALTQAFARFASKDLGKRAPDGSRPEGTRPGYLALLSHEDVE